MAAARPPGLEHRRTRAAAAGHGCNPERHPHGQRDAARTDREVKGCEETAIAGFFSTK